MCLVRLVNWQLYDTVRLLIYAGVNIEAQDDNGNTPLLIIGDVGAYSGVRMVKILIDAGADITTRNNAGLNFLDMIPCDIYPPDRKIINDALAKRSTIITRITSIKRVSQKVEIKWGVDQHHPNTCLLYTSPSPRDRQKSRMPSSA